jgi:RimJ/RimL family protein N-acetyltransferase
VQRKGFSMEEAEAWVGRAMDDSGEDRKYAILVEGHPEPVGFTALYGLSRDSGPELGALIGDELRSSGVGRRAEALTIARAFDEFGVHRVYGEIPAFNEAAKRTVAGLGWRHEETLPGGGDRDGEPFDLEIWAVLPEDFHKALERGAKRTSKSDSS